MIKSAAPWTLARDTINSLYGQVSPRTAL